MTDPAIALEGVHKSYGSLHVLRGIDLVVAPSEVVCLIGSSGSGKSTVLRCINGLEPIDTGRIFVNGTDLAGPGVDLDQARRHVGIVFQSLNLFPHLSVLDNITLAPRRVLRVARAAAEAQALSLLERFGLADRARDFPERLSGGQQQRIAIVRALAIAPKVMLFDEVTSALDPELVGEVLGLIRDLAAGGMTMVIATHEMGFARETAHRVCFLDGGRIVEEGSPTKMFHAPDHSRTREFLQRIITAGRL